MISAISPLVIGYELDTVNEIAVEVKPEDIVRDKKQTYTKKTLPEFIHDNPFNFQFPILVLLKYEIPSICALYKSIRTDRDPAGDPSSSKLNIPKDRSRKKQDSPTSPLQSSEKSQSHASVSIYKDGCFEGYTLCSMDKVTSLFDRDFFTILIDMDGQEIRRWPLVPRPARILPDGSVIGGIGVKCLPGFVEIFNLTQLDWNGSVVWSFNNWDDDGNGLIISRQHHDYQREGNPVGYYAPGQEFIENGKTLVLAHKNFFNKSICIREILDDVIYEVEWNGNLTDFEWYASEHFNQMGFNWRAKHGIKYWTGIMGKGDWIHINSISVLGKNHWYDEGDERFHPENIILDSRHGNFIAIISKVTGDIVWRIGPDFSKNTVEGRKLGQIIGQHHAHMIPDGLPGEGNILVFDNGGMSGYGFFGWPNCFRMYSRVIEFNPVTLDIVWQYAHKNGSYPFPRYGEDHRFYSTLVGSAQRLPNGNTLIAEGTAGRIFEVTDSKEIVWEYITPSIFYPIYRAYRVPPEWIPGNPAGYDYWEDTNN